MAEGRIGLFADSEWCGVKPDYEIVYKSIVHVSQARTEAASHLRGLNEDQYKYPE